MIIVAPLRVRVTSREYFTLNLNPYRVTHYQILNKAKIEYKELLREQLKTLVFNTPIEINYTLYPKTKRLCDISNILSIHDKFFCDALTSYHCIPDDNYLYVKKVTYLFGSIDKHNPRVEITIRSFNEY